MPRAALAFFSAALLLAVGSVRAAEALPLITTAELKALASGPADKWALTLVDARAQVEFSENHIVGAVNIPASETRTQLPARVKDKARLLVFYCNGPRCTKSTKAAKTALELGYTNVKEYNEGLPAWGMARLPLEGKPLPAFDAPVISPKDLEAALKSATAPLLVDIRDQIEFEAWHLAGAKGIPIDELTARVKEIPDGALCLVDHIGHQTPVAARLLASLGHKKIQRLDGGVLAWKSAGLPVEARK